jgi:hypothetical protein
VADRPTLYVTNWSSRRLHGPGRKLTIMAAPRRWEHGEGRVPDCIPALADLLDYQSGAIDVREYRRRFEEDIAFANLRPGALTFRNTPWTPGSVEPMVLYGDTLLCACSREAAAKGECHRVWAADALVRAGWRVILDGVEVSDV